MQQRLKPAAAVSLVLYAAGIPCVFLALLVIHRDRVVRDQVLKVQGLGSTVATNADFPIRRRFQKLYNIFRPECVYWRLVILVRKFCLTSVALMFSSTPLFQAWCVRCKRMHFPWEHMRVSPSPSTL